MQHSIGAANRCAQLALAHHPTGNARSATTQGCGVISVVIAANVNHQRAAFEIRQLQARCQHRLRGKALGIHIQRGQIAQVAVAPRRAVYLGVFRVVVTASRTRWYDFAIFGGRRTAGVLVQMEAMQPRREPVQGRREHQTVARF